jgi:hypothetical protein
MRVLPVACALVALAAITATTTGCGPIISTYLIVGAQADLEGAQAAEAEKYAVYEYTAASEYLHKAREEQGYADFGPSIDFAYKAQDLAQKATARAQDEKKKISEGPGAEWEAPPSETGQPSVIIKKKPDGAKNNGPTIKVVPIPVEDGPKPK